MAAPPPENSRIPPLVPVAAPVNVASSTYGTSTDHVEHVRVLQERLRDAQEALKRRDFFLAALSHELRTPLNPILLLASNLADDPATPEQYREAFALIRKNVQLELYLVDDLLDLNVIHHQKLRLASAEVNLHLVINEAVRNVQHDIVEKDLRLELVLAADLPCVRGDAVRLQQVLWNLIRNAIKFTGKGGQIVIETSNDISREHVLIEVRDTGVGMTVEELKRIFHAFEQGDHTKEAENYRFGGLGMGLAICRQLAEMHGGRIAAKSAGSGLGSAFILELDVVGKPASSLPVVAPETAKPSSPAQRLRILVIEDHASTRDAMRYLLSGWGHTVALANNAAEALVHAATGRFDVAISDLGLPDMDGNALIRELLAIQPTLRPIALSGHGSEVDRQSSLSNGFRAHLVKPIDVSQLSEALRDVMKSD